MRFRNLVRSFIHNAREYKNRFRSHKAIFEEAYQKGYWANSETVSGSGSTIAQTHVVRSVLSMILREYEIKTILDIPCGDYNWMKEVDLSNVKYLGCDIVDAIIQENTRKFHHTNISFCTKNVLVDPLPQVDLILCRDCLVHFSNQDVFRAIHNIKLSNSKYLLMTTFQSWPENKNIVTGSWRPIDFEKPPFNFRKPIEVYYEQTNEVNGMYSSKALGFWRISDIP